MTDPKRKVAEKLTDKDWEAVSHAYGSSPRVRRLLDEHRDMKAALEKIRGILADDDMTGLRELIAIQTVLVSLEAP